MSSIDDLFKKPATLKGSSNGKRKLEVNQDPTQVYKSAKLSSNGQANTNGHNRTTIEDVADEDLEAGPQVPPDDDEEYGPAMPDEGDDEEGRFFGGGITKDENEILDYMDGQEDLRPDKIDAAWVRKMALNFEKRISKNAEMRAKFESQPEKFMASEADLDSDIKALSILCEHTNLYGTFAELGCVASLVSLLAHENTDIAITAIEIISELTDEDVEVEPEQWSTLVDAMLDADLLSLLISNFGRLDEQNEADRSGIYHALSVLENLSSRSSLAEKICKDTGVLPWLLKRIQLREASVSQNKQYAAEVLAILLQSAPANRKTFAELEGADALLQILAMYRKRDPAKDSEEEEYVENVFDALTGVVDEPEGKAKFIEAEGVELCLIMIREGKMSKARALRLLDHATGGYTGGEVCERLVEAAGLKVIFSMFMKKQDSETLEHILGIFSSLLRSLPAESAPRIRTLAKFVEKDYEKLTKLVDVRREYAGRVSAVDEVIRTEQANMDAEEREEAADEWLSRRLDAGLFSLQTVDVVLTWLLAEDLGAAERIKELLKERDESVANMRGSIQGMIVNCNFEAREVLIMMFRTTRFVAVDRERGRENDQRHAHHVAQVSKLISTLR